MNNTENLNRNSIGTGGLVFQAMGQLSPIGIFGGSILGAAAFAMGATPLSFIIGLLASLLAGNSIYQYSKKMASARGYYGYIGNGLGITAGALSAFLYILYEFANLLFILSYYILTFSPTLGFVTGLSVPYYYSYLYIILISIPAFYVVYKGIKLSYRSQIVANMIQIIFVVSISIAIIAFSPKIGLLPFTAYKVGIKGVFLGFITGSYLSFAGFGSIVPLGEEAKAAKKSIGRAVLYIILIMGSIYLLGSYAMVAGWGINAMASFSQSIYPGFIIVGKFGHLPNDIFFILNFFVVYPLFVTMATALSRNIYAMAKDNMLPGGLSAIHGKYRSPHIALWYILAIFTALSIISSVIFFYMEKGFFNGFFDDFLFFATVSTVTTLVIHVMVNFSLYSKYRQEGEHNAMKVSTHLILPSVSTVIIVLAVYYSVVSLTFPIAYGPVIILAYGIITMLYIFIKKKDILKINLKEELYE
jgi:amino acid transporter